MSYQTLYRKFRPATFEEMVGQEHITQTLKNQIISDRIGHAYLFTGGRGTGKTSSAKIMARAINCLNPINGEPCNECEICKEILANSLTDVVEMDAASNNSVEDIRQIRDEVNFLPTKAKYRVYIIDEVHMLSTGAFNALLKTLEEPPKHVKFILATTEPQKLPATILSRCQRFDFKRISNENIKKRLKIISEECKIAINEGALNMIAILSEGAMRDAISILERCIQDGESEITVDKIKDLVGIPKFEIINKLVNGIILYNVDYALQATQDVLDQGKELTNFLWEIIKYVKDILIFKTNGKVEIYNEEEIKKIEELSKLASKDRLLGLIYGLSDLENTMKWSSQKTILFQTGIIKACSKFENQGIEELSDRINKLEKIVLNQNGIVSNKQENSKKVIEIYNTNEKPNVKINMETNSVNENKSINEKQNVDSRASIKDYQNISNGNGVHYWNSIVSVLKNKRKVILFTNLINTFAIKIGDDTLEINFLNGLTSFGKDVLEKDENKQELLSLISKEDSSITKIKYVDAKGISKQTKKVENSLDGLMNNFDIPINIIED